VTRGLHALAMLGVKVWRTHVNSWALRLRSGNVRRVNAMWIKKFVACCCCPVLERDEAVRWPHSEEKGAHPCTAWQGYSAVGGGPGGKARWRTRGSSDARLVIKTSAPGIQVAQWPWRQAAGTAELGDIAVREGTSRCCSVRR
jgi:hypothetical protein